MLKYINTQHLSISTYTTAPVCPPVYLINGASEKKCKEEMSILACPFQKNDLSLKMYGAGYLNNVCHIF
jgi:hypothetical protein